MLSTGYYKYKEDKTFFFKPTNARKFIRCGVSENGEIFVHGSRKSNLQDLIDFVLKNEQWLEEKKAKLTKNNNPYNDLYNFKDRFMLFGALYRFEIVELAEGGLDLITEEDDHTLALHLTPYELQRLCGVLKVPVSQDPSTFDLSNEYKAKVVDHYIRFYLSIFLRGKINKLLEKYCPLMGLPFPRLEVKEYKSKYGCCYHARNLICIATSLLLFPEKFLESIVVHELAHFYEQNHSDRFYRIVYRYFPEYAYYDSMLNNSLSYLTALYDQLRQEQRA